jgi:hypothetical protein
MRVWFASFLVLFGTVELLQWVKHFTLPLPAFIVGGALLAIASNYGKDAGWSFQDLSSQVKLDRKPAPTDADRSPPESNLSPNPTIPPTPLSQPPRPISFTIQRPVGEGE